MSSVSIVIRAKNEASATFDRVKGDIKEFSNDGQKAMGGLKAANEAMSKAMRGDLVGAAHSAASAFKNLWAVVISNPVLLGLAAATAAIVYLAKSHMDAKRAAAEHAAAEKELNDEIARTKGNDPISVKKEIAAQMVNQDDLDGLVKMRDKYRELAEDAERFYRGSGLGKERLSELVSYMDVYAEAIDKLVEKREKAAADAAKAELETAQKVAEELAKIEQQKNADMEAALLERNLAVADALDEQTRLAEEQLKEERRIRKEAAAQAVEDAKAAAKAAAEAYNSAVAASNESFKRATNSEYRREQEKKERDEKKAAEKAQRAYERALEKSKKGIRGKDIDAALEAQKAAFGELEALDNKLRAEDAQKAAEAAYQQAVLDTAKNTKETKDAVDSLRADLTGGGGGAA